MAWTTKVISKKSTHLEDSKKSFNISMDKNIEKHKSKGNTFKVAELIAEKSATNAYYDSIIASYKKIEKDLISEKTETTK